MEIECPNCMEKIKISTETYLNQRTVKCSNCLLTIDLRDTNGVINNLRMQFEEEKVKKENRE